MTSGFTAAAYVKMLEAAVATARHAKLMMEADQNKAAYAYARAAERLYTLEEVLAEGKKLMNAIAAGTEWFVQPDGTVRVPAIDTFRKTVQQETLEGL